MIKWVPFWQSTTADLTYWRRNNEILSFQNDLRIYYPRFIKTFCLFLQKSFHNSFLDICLRYIRISLTTFVLLMTVCVMSYTKANVVPGGDLYIIRNCWRPNNGTSTNVAFKAFLKISLWHTCMTKFCTCREF